MAKDPEEEVEKAEGSEEEEPEEEPSDEEPESEELEEEEIVTVPPERRGGGGWVIALILIIIAAVAIWYFGVKRPADQRAAEAERQQKAQEAGTLVKDARGELATALKSIADNGDVAAGLQALDAAKKKAKQAALKAVDADDPQAQQAYNTLASHIEDAVAELIAKNDAVEAKRKELQKAEKELQAAAEERVQSLLDEAKTKAALHTGRALESESGEQ